MPRVLVVTGMPVVSRAVRRTLVATMLRRRARGSRGRELRVFRIAWLGGRGG
ncbi:MAG: hypothetical protein H0T68_05840 [Gemmatimonadales bacterium]|nr:hypothetical protein [Gemmatimonadales bacterium]